jgi:hypothetical protein
MTYTEAFFIVVKRCDSSVGGLGLNLTTASFSFERFGFLAAALGVGWVGTSQLLLQFFFTTRHSGHTKCRVQDDHDIWNAH